MKKLLGKLTVVAGLLGLGILVRVIGLAFAIRKRLDAYLQQRRSKQ